MTRVHPRGLGTTMLVAAEDHLPITPRERTPAAQELLDLSRHVALVPGASSPPGRVGCPEEPKGAMAYLASQASSHITRQTLYVHDGWTAGQSQ